MQSIKISKYPTDDVCCFQGTLDVQQSAPIASNSNPVVATNNNNNNNNNDLNTLSGIRNEFVGGVGAVFGSGGHLIGLGVHTVENGVMSGVHAVENGVMTVARPVVNAASAVGQGFVNAAHDVKEGVVNAARPVVNVAASVVNKTVNVASNIGHAGGQIVDAFGNSIQQSKNITGQLFENIGRRRWLIFSWFFL